MYKRLRDGLFAPKKIIEYIKDKMYMPFLILIVFSILMTIPIVISNLTFTGLDYNTKLSVASVFNGEDIDYKIENSLLVNTSGKSDASYEKYLSSLIKVRLSEAEDDNLSAIYVIELGKDGFCVRFSYIRMFEGKYADYDVLKDLDLSKLSNKNSSEWDDIFSVVDSILKDYYKSTIVATIISSIIRYFGYLIIIALLLSLSFVFKFRGYLNYSAMFKMSVYYTAPFALGVVLTNLFSINIFSFIGIVISVVYTFIGSTSIISKLISSDRK